VLSSLESFEAAVDCTVAELGRLDILVNNAGVGMLGRVESAPLDEREQLVRVKLCRRTVLSNVCSHGYTNSESRTFLGSLADHTGRAAYS
jgi:NAD(P)-dependent dehydrogenase (short-subunit alcohol dehydrogenase family)